MATTSHNDIAMSDLIPAHLAYLRASGYSKHTITSREELLRRVHAALPYGLAYAATDELESWLATEGWSQWTRCTYAMHVRAFYRWATRGEHALLDGDPTADMAHPRTPRCLPNPVTDADLAAAMDRSPEPWYTAILLAAAAGLRADEIARLRREDVTEARIVVRGKGGDPGLVDTHPQIWAHIASWPTGPLVTSHGKPVTGRWLSAHARHHFDHIGMPHVHMHRFRHWYASALLDGGANLRTVQEAMRHRSVTSTQGYTMVRNGQRRQAIATLPIPTGRQKN